MPKDQLLIFQIPSMSGVRKVTSLANLSLCKFFLSNKQVEPYHCYLFYPVRKEIMAMLSKNYIREKETIILHFRHCMGGLKTRWLTPWQTRNVSSNHIYLEILLLIILELLQNFCIWNTCKIVISLSHKDFTKNDHTPESYWW